MTILRTVPQIRYSKLQNEFPNDLYLEVRKEKSGLGTAYIHGFRWAIAKELRTTYLRWMLIFLIDLQIFNDLHRACLNGADVAIGSRYKKGVNVVNWPLYRVLLSYGASFYVKLITGMRIHDPTAGFVCYKRKVLEAINLDAVKFMGYAFQIEMKFRASLKNSK